MNDPTDTAAPAGTAPDDAAPTISEGIRTTVVPRSRRTIGPADTERAAAEDPVAVVAATRHRYDLGERPEPPPVPHGWYALMGSDELVGSDVRTVIAVGRELVAYRGADGVPRVIDAHCPHLGAHLGGGHVKDDAIACPYHGWRFGAEGTCVEIPYSEARIPSRACVRTYPVCEQDGFVFVWYHAGGAPPAYEIPRVSEVDDPAWSDAHVWTGELVAALQEMAENNVDYAHLYYVHRRAYVPDQTSEFRTDGPFSTVVETLPDGTEFDRHTWGPGIAILRVPNLMTIFTCTTPIDRRNCRLRWHFFFTPEIEPMAAELIEGVTGDFGLTADVPIWRDKVFLPNPILVKADGNIAEFRRWYAQFYE